MSLPALARTCLVLFGLSTAFPIIAGVLNTDRPPRWLGIADVAVAVVLFVATASLMARGRRAVGDHHRLAALRASHRVIAIIPALLLAFFVAGHRVNWTVIVVGLAWRGWLLLHSLPTLAAVLMANGRPRAGQNQRGSGEFSAGVDEY